MNFCKEGTIGRTTPEGVSELFATLPEKSVGNGIRFDRRGTMFIADYVNHNILMISPGSREATVFAHEPSMSQPNDLAITGDGVLFASDPNWGKGTGQIWRIDTAGKVTKVATDLGTTNGIEVSPDGHTLFVNESVQRNIWSFQITETGELTEKKLVKRFPTMASTECGATSRAICTSRATARARSSNSRPRARC